MNPADAYGELERRFARMSAVNRASAILNWDRSAMMPAGAAEDRADQLATLGVIAHGMIAAPEMAELLGRAEQGDVLAVDRDAAGLGRGKAHQQLQDAGLAGTGGTPEYQRLAGIDPEGDAFQRRRAVGVVAQGQALGAQDNMRRHLVQQQALGERGLAGVGVGNDRKRPAAGRFAGGGLAHGRGVSRQGAFRQSQSLSNPAKLGSS